MEMCKNIIMLILNRLSNFYCVEKLRNPQLFSRLKIYCLTFVQNVMVFAESYFLWKKWNLDARDDWVFYLHNLRTEKLYIYIFQIIKIKLYFVSGEQLRSFLFFDIIEITEPIKTLIWSFYTFLISVTQKTG